MRDSEWLWRATLLLLSLAVVCTIGLGELPWSDVWHGAVARLAGLSTEWNALLDERLPRLLVLFATGASLAVSGAVMQSLFQNPLAAPSVLGITFGGAFAVLLVFVSGWYLAFPFLIPLAATLGCLATLWLVTRLSGGGAAGQLQSLILHGIAVSTVLIAVQKALLFALREHWHLVQTVTEWEAGSSFNRTWYHVHLQLPLALVGIGGCLRYARELNILTLGEEEAHQLGVDVRRVRSDLILCVALLSGGALSALGGLAFFGLILPHLVRRMVGPDNVQVIPLCIVLGGTLLLALDQVLRLGEIQMFSIGNVSAILGGLFFLLLLTQKRSDLCFA